MRISMESSILILFFLTGKCIFSIYSKDFRQYDDTLKAFTVATNETDGFRQFLRSTKLYNISLKVLGGGEKWDNGNMNSTGDGFKVNLLREALQPYKNSDNQIIIFTDSYDMLYLCDSSEIIKKFLNFDARIVFSAEAIIWPDTSLIVEYPQVEVGYRFLNPGGFIGFANTIYEMLELGTSSVIKGVSANDLFFTNTYLNEHLRNYLNIKLDHTAEIFQNLYGASNDIQLLPENNIFQMNNIVFKTKPCLLHGNGQSKYAEFRSVSNYLAERWTLDEGCKDCDESAIIIGNLSVNEYPKVVIAVFISKPTPFFREFFEKILRQNYPKRRICIFVHNNVSYHQNELEMLLHGRDEYDGIKLLKSIDINDTAGARSFAMDYCIVKSCDYYFNVDSDAHLDSKDTLITLVGHNKSIVAPLLIKPFKAWSNFWGAVDSEGYYKRSFDYMDIVYSRIRGLWNIPYVSTCYLINATILRNSALRPTYFHLELDYEMAFCNYMRGKGVYMFVDNRQNFGHIIELDGFNITKTNPNLFELLSNRWDWEQAYIHFEYEEYFKPDTEYLQPCPDVYSFPIFSARFCNEILEIMKEFGQWSDDTTLDTGLQNGDEVVSIRHIHMKQIDFDYQWLEFLRLFVTPLQQMAFVGYNDDPPRSLMNFVARYSTDDQPLLQPHKDSFSYTINVALNQPNIDFKGGGRRFLRYKCQVTDMKLGWMLMHPSRLTHSYEELPIIQGVRYVLTSLIDP